jgi:hypothetical protein
VSIFRFCIGGDKVTSHDLPAKHLLTITIWRLSVTVFIEAAPK